MRLFPTVGLLGLKPEALLAIQIVDSVYRACNAELMLTSITDGKHGTGSLHYKGLAFDCRISNVDAANGPRLLKGLRDALNNQFDVVDEGSHIHVEFDPK